jgi:hypothetical protein
MILPCPKSLLCVRPHFVVLKSDSGVQQTVLSSVLMAICSLVRIRMNQLPVSVTRWQRGFLQLLFSEKSQNC